MTSDYTDDVLAACPRCGAAAHVRGGVRFVCPSCRLQHSRIIKRRFGDNGICFERAENLNDWYGWLTPLVASDKTCTKCGNRIEVALKSQLRAKVARIMDTAEGACGTCHLAQTVGVVWVPYLNAAEACEGGFGVRLYLVEETPKGVLFAFNRDHAQKLLDYVSADQRGEAAEGHEAMFALLPGWVKAAKNRKLVEKVLSRMIDMAL